MIFGRWVSHAVATSTLILHTNKCTTWSHHSTWGCFLELPLRVSEAQCLGCAEELPRGSKCCPGPWYLKMSIFLCVFRGREGVWGELPGPVCRTTTDGQLDIYDASFWCHPHATYASPCSYDFLEIAFSQSLTAVTMATQSQLWGTDPTNTYKHKQTPVWKPFSSPKSPHAQQDIPNPLSGSLLSA